ncbi:uncharacterized protein [Solanum lycopersicum]|uniref:uncharacterized protein n=1 Tax=Solanum lycopersicum TaxID=4081 RepID=UPI003748A60B
MVESLPDLEANSTEWHAFQFGKKHRKPFENPTLTASQKLKIVHTDVVGPQRTLSLQGNIYYVLFIDDYTRMCWFFFLKFKSEVDGVFCKFRKLVEYQSNCKIQDLRSGNMKEYTSVKFNSFCEKAIIVHQLNTPYTLEQNGVSERRNIWMMEMTRCMLHEKELPKISGQRQHIPLNVKNLTKRKMLFRSKHQCSWRTKNEYWRQELEDDHPVKGRKLLLYIYQSCNVSIYEPTCPVEALQDPKWKKAMEEDISMIEKNKTCMLVNKPDDRIVIGVRWVCRTKLNAEVPSTNTR